MKVADKVKRVRESLEGYENVTLVAATKYMDLEQTKELLNAGIKHIGENRNDMFQKKYEVLGDDPDIKWHYFGNIQLRRARDLANKIDFLHSLDNLALAAELNKRLEKPLDCFVQVNIMGEDRKIGVPIEKVIPFIKNLSEFPMINVIGLMCIAQLTFDMRIVEESFKSMKELQEEVQDLELKHAPCTELSMGMSNDYKAALKHGATYIRLGRVFL